MFSIEMTHLFKSFVAFGSARYAKLIYFPYVFYGITLVLRKNFLLLGGLGGVLGLYIIVPNFTLNTPTNTKQLLLCCCSFFPLFSIFLTNFWEAGWMVLIYRLDGWPYPISTSSSGVGWVGVSQRNLFPAGQAELRTSRRANSTPTF